MGPAEPRAPGRRPYRGAGDERVARLAGCGGGCSLRSGRFLHPARGPGPAGHFRTSVHVSAHYATAVATLLRRVDTALGHPAELALVDVGAGRGELLTGVLGALPAAVRARLRPYAVERAARPRASTR